MIFLRIDHAVIDGCNKERACDDRQENKPEALNIESCISKKTDVMLVRVAALGMSALGDQLVYVQHHLY